MHKRRRIGQGNMGRGFTLIEIMTAVSVFAVVMVISMGAILGVFDANRKSDSLKTVMDNLNFAVDSMSREMRFGKNYHCGTGTLTTPQNCSSGGTLVSFLSSDGQQIAYRLNGTQIEKSVDGGSTYIAVTAPEINIESLSFYVLGASPAPANTLQPRVLIKIKGSAGSKAKTKSDFSLQTLVSQRLQDK